VSAWTEAKSARKEASSAQEKVASQDEEVQQRRLELGQVIRERDQPRSHAAEAVTGLRSSGDSWLRLRSGQPRCPLGPGP
jgi:hypothetical protein